MKTPCVQEIATLQPNILTVRSSNAELIVKEYNSYPTEPLSEIGKLQRSNRTLHKRRAYCERMVQKTDSCPSVTRVIRMSHKQAANLAFRLEAIARETEPNHNEEESTCEKSKLRD